VSSDPAGSTSDPPSRLGRRLGTGDAVVVGMGAMIGSGVFVALGPAANAAGSWLLLGLAAAAVVAFCNAISSAQLAVRYPESGGTYVYGRRQLGDGWGYLAGWSFVVGKTASCAAMAFTVGAYAWPEQARAVAVAVVIAVTVVNLAGIEKTARLTRVILALVLATLVGVVVSGLTGPTTPDLFRDAGTPGVLDVARSAGFLFFAFAGYARLATLGEEVRDPRRTLPRAIPLALGLTLVVYATVAVTALVALGPQRLATSTAPLRDVAELGGFPGFAPVVTVGAGIAAVGVLVSLLVGVSRTTFAMAANGDLPRVLAAVDDRRGVPRRAELAVAAVVVAVVLVADLRGAIGFSSFAVLGYYAVANLAAWTLGRDDRRWPRWLAGLGVVGCVGLAVALPLVSVVGGAVVLLSGVLAHLVVTRTGRSDGGPR
jgi:basic amino acid/polyamine antiporter, APA family